MERVDIYSQISRNKRNSIFLSIIVFAVLSALVFAISQVFAPEYATIILAFSFVVIVADVILSYNYGDKVVLSSVKAKPADEIRHRHLIDSVEGLAIAAGIPKPNAYVMESPEINAFACGKDPAHSSICVTTGALEKLNRNELEGVIAHEMSHIKNYDIRFATLVAVLVGLAAIVSYTFTRSMWYGGVGGNRRDNNGAAIILVVALVLAIVAPLITKLVQAAVSRKREYLADASGAQLTRYPEGLANALEKIKKENHGKMKISEAVSHLFISDPNKAGLDSILATHPPIDKRIEILRAM